MVGLGHGSLVTLEFQIIVIAEQVMKPLHHLFRLIYPACGYEFGHLAAQTRRTTYQTFMILFQVILVSSRMGIEPVSPSSGYNLYQIMVSFLILGKQYKMIVGTVQLLAVTLLLPAGCHIDLAAYYRLEMTALLLESVINLVAVVLELLNAHHVAVIGNGNSTHTIGYSLVNHLFDIGLAVKQRVLRMDMKMYEFLHSLS